MEKLLGSTLSVKKQLKGDQISPSVSNLVLTKNLYRVFFLSTTKIIGGAVGRACAFN